MIVETLANQFFRVRETGNPNAVHVWHGIEVKRIRGAYVPKARAREILVRKLGTGVVEDAR